MDVPGLAPVSLQIPLTPRQYNQLQGIADARKTNLADMLKSDTKNMVEDLLKSGK
jgi:hypothetical protein